MQCNNVNVRKVQNSTKRLNMLSESMDTIMQKSELQKYHKLFAQISELMILIHKYVFF